LAPKKFKSDVILALTYASHQTHAMNFFSRLLESIFQNALLRLIFWFLIGVLAALLLLKVFKVWSHPSVVPKNNLTIVQN
jgi:hypothetical protein